MLAPTHIVAGQSAYLAACLAVGHAPTLPEAWAAAACALAPDLDMRQGIVGRLFPFLSEPIEYRFGHRTLTHSLLLTVALAVLLWPLLPFGWWLAVVAGFASHAVADMMTPAGVCWFWPARWRCVLPGSERYRMAAMGWGELVFAVVIGAAAFPLLSAAQTGQHAGGWIKAAIGDVSAARARYDAEKGRSTWTLRIEGRDNRSFADIGGEYLVIGPWGESGFLIETPEGPRAACRAASCDWYADRAAAIEGEAETVTVMPLHAERATAAGFLDALERLEASGAVYVSGTLRGRGIEPAAPSVDVTGERVSLYYASPEVLRERLSGALGAVSVVAQVRHAPGATVPPVTLAEVSPAAVVPEGLRKWME